MNEQIYMAITTPKHHYDKTPKNRTNHKIPKRAATSTIAKQSLSNSHL